MVSSMFSIFHISPYRIVFEHNLRSQKPQDSLPSQQFARNRSPAPASLFSPPGLVVRLLRRFRVRFRAPRRASHIPRLQCTGWTLDARQISFVVLTSRPENLPPTLFVFSLVILPLTTQILRLLYSRSLHLPNFFCRGIPQVLTPDSSLPLFLR